MVGLTRRLASILGLVKDTVTVPSDVPLDLTTSISSQTIRHVSVTLEDISLEPCQFELLDESNMSGEHQLPPYQESEPFNMTFEGLQASFFVVLQENHERETESREVKAENNELKASNNKLKAENNGVKFENRNATTKTQVLETKIHELKTENHQVKTREHELETENDRLESRVKELEADGEHKNRETEIFRDRVNDLEEDGERKNRETEEFKDRVKDLEGDGEHKDREIEELRDRVKVLEEDGERKDRAIKDLENDNKHKDHTITNAKRRWRDAHHESRSLQTDKHKLRAAEEENATLRSDIEKAHKDVRKACRVIQTIKNTFSTRRLPLGMKHQLEGKALKEQHTSEVQGLRSKLIKRQSYIADLKANLKDSTDKAEASKKKLAVKDSEIKKLQVRLKTSRQLNQENALRAAALTQSKARYAHARKVLQRKEKAKTTETVNPRSNACLSGGVAERKQAIDNLCREHQLRLREVKQQRKSQIDAKNRRIDQLEESKRQLLFHLQAMDGDTETEDMDVDTETEDTTSSSGYQSTSASADLDMLDTAYDSGYDTEDEIL